MPDRQSVPQFTYCFECAGVVGVDVQCDDSSHEYLAAVSLQEAGRWRSYDERRARRELLRSQKAARRKERPLLERLRDSGALSLSDGYSTVRFADPHDAWEAAEYIDWLQLRVDAAIELMAMSKPTARHVPGCGCRACELAAVVADSMPPEFRDMPIVGWSDSSVIDEPSDPH